MEDNSIRLNKYIAMCGVYSRREADKLIESGHVKINDKRAVSGMKVGPKDKVLIDMNVVKPVKNKVVLAFYKPTGVVCTKKDEHAETTIYDVIDYPKRLQYAGRLDADSEGLLILTNDGDLINGMMRGSHKHEKEYIVRIDQKVTSEFLHKMEKGIWIDELKTKTRDCVCVPVKNDSNGFRIILTQGLNRQIRRMCNSFNYKVKELKRIRVMNIHLDNLKPGEYREIYGEELDKLYSMCGMKNN